MFSFGIEPSMTSTKGASRRSTSASRNGLRNSSPPSVGESTLLWRWILGIPGMAPSSTSSMLGCPAAVTDTESPSQLIPSEIQRMCTSSTAGDCTSVAMGHPSDRGQFILFELQRVDVQLLAAHELEIQAPAGAAAQRE